MGFWNFLTNFFESDDPNYKRRLVRLRRQISSDGKLLPRQALRILKADMPCKSRFGGNPNLPVDMEWPISPNSRQMNLLAQIDCTEIPRGLGLPETGTLWFFYDYDEMSRDDEDYCAVLYSEDPLPEEACKPNSTCEPWPETPITFERFESTQEDAILGKAKELGQHQMLGYPLYIQDENMAGPDFVMLLQLDSNTWNPGPNWVWGNNGRLFFWVWYKDLADRDFTHSHITLDSK